VIFYRIARKKFGSPASAFSGEGAALFAHRWNQARKDIRAVYASDSLALTSLECLVHLNATPQIFPASVYFVIDVPDAALERPSRAQLPKGWDHIPAGDAPRDFGMAFLRSQRATALVLPTVVVPKGENVLINPRHPSFSLKWVSGPFPFKYDSRL
jgi:RES domain-containing protein